MSGRSGQRSDAAAGLRGPEQKSLNDNVSKGDRVLSRLGQRFHLIGKLRGNPYSMSRSPQLCRVKTSAARMAKVIWKKVIHRDDATDSEKAELVEMARRSPPLSAARAIFHPGLVALIHKDISRYQGESWGIPRLAWFMYTGSTTVFVVRYLIGELPHPRVYDNAAVVLGGAGVVFLVTVLYFHLMTTVSMRLYKACVWCHVIQRDADRSIVATLSILAYRLPFIDPTTRVEISPWERSAETYQGPAHRDVLLETTRDLSQSNIADIYDESVCWTRSAVSIPSSAKRYAVGGVTLQDDVIIKEVRALGRMPWRWPRAEVIVAIGAIPVALAAVATLITAF